eukprot:Em0018g1023a
MLSRLCVRNSTSLAKQVVQSRARQVASATYQQPCAWLDFLSPHHKHASYVAGRSARVVRCSPFSTNSEGATKGTEPKDTEPKAYTDVPKEVEPKSYIQKVKKVLKEYGTVAVVFHTAVALCSYGTCYLLVKHGMDVDKVLEYLNVHTYAAAKGASTAAIAYLLHKVFLPLSAPVGMQPSFDVEKRTSLERADLSRKGAIDDAIVPLVEHINSQETWYTTSSCSGRVTIYCQVAVSSGFRNSGITVGKRDRIMLAVRSTHSLEAPVACNGKLLVDVDYITHLVELANTKMAENLQRIDRFTKQLTCPDCKKSKKAEDLIPVKSYSSAQQNVDRQQKAEVTPDYMLLTENILPDLFA